jgi:hypothetical protein
VGDTAPEMCKTRWSGKYHAASLFATLSNDSLTLTTVHRGCLPRIRPPMEIGERRELLFPIDRQELQTAG